MLYALSCVSGIDRQRLNEDQVEYATNFPSTAGAYEDSFIYLLLLLLWLKLSFFYSIIFIISNNASINISSISVRIIAAGHLPYITALFSKDRHVLSETLLTPAKCKEQSEAKQTAEERKHDSPIVQWLLAEVAPLLADRRTKSQTIKKETQHNHC